MDRKGKSNFLEEELTGMIAETEARQQVLFGGLNSGLTNKPNTLLGSVNSERGGAERLNHG